MTTAPTRLDGGQMFVRYAYPPNERGSCGPAEFSTTFEYGVAGTSDAGLRVLASQFSGAWPYLELLAAEAGIGDPLDHRVVEAYWVGNDLLDRVDMVRFGNSLEERFRRRSGVSWGDLSAAIPAGGVPHHSFHVFSVYPWVGLLGADRGPDPLFILDQCRIRWGKVITVLGDEAVVESRPLAWDGRGLSLGPVRTETATLGIDGKGFLDDLQPGEWVSLHWRWVCDRLSRSQLRSLERFSTRQLRITNEELHAAGKILE